MNPNPIGILLVNLGTPDSAEIPAVRRFLREFLADPRVIDLPTLPRWLLLQLFILPFRPKQSAKAYQKIWQTNGSPLLIHTQRLREQIAALLGENYIVEIGMRYGNPSLSTALNRLTEKACNKIIVLPLFPQYSSATTGSVNEKILGIVGQQKNIPSINIIGSFYQHPLFIDAYASIIKEACENFSADMLLFSYHGLPERHIEKSNCKKTICSRQKACPQEVNENLYCYRRQCYVTSRLLAEALKLAPDQYTVAFQSRLGKTPWIKPYTDFVLPELYQRGIRNLAVACPSFVADCLETLEEIGIRAQAQWKALGGEKLLLIPCLNSHPIWVNTVTKLLENS